MGEIQNSVTNANTLTADGLLNEVALARDMFHDAEMQDLQIGLPLIPRAHKAKYPTAVSENIQFYYTSIYSSLFKCASESLKERYQSKSLDGADLLRRLLENPTLDSEK